MATPNLATVETAQLTASSPKDRAWSIDAILPYATFSLLLLAPLAFGAVEFWAIFCLQLVATFLLAVWAALQLRSGHVVIQSNPLFAPMLAFALLIGIQLASGRSAYAHETLNSALLYTLYGIIAFLVTQTLRTTAQVKRLAVVITGYGVCVAVFAVLQSLSSNNKLYWIRTPRAGGWVYGPYVNHNHYAGLMEMLFPIALVAALTRHVSGRWKSFAVAAAIFMASTIFLSGSRGGMVAFLVQMVVLGAFVGFQKNRRTALLVGVVLAIITCLMLWLGGEALTSRVASIHTEARTELAGGLRLTIDHDGLRMAAKAPVLGWGLGTFSTVYPQFRTFFTDKFINQAHNDYLQLLVEGGVAGFALMVWFLTVMFRSALRKIGDWTLDYNGAVALAALLGCIGILVHSFVDFNLQVPANAALFYTLCVVAAAPTNFAAAQRVRRRRSIQSGLGFESSTPPAMNLPAE